MQALPECEATRWNPLFTDVVPVGGNKSIGMEKILAYFGTSGVDDEGIVHALKHFHIGGL